jgi:hypothetical protein
LLPAPLLVLGSDEVAASDKALPSEYLENTAFSSIKKW